MRRHTDMIQNYEEAIEWIHGRLRLGIKPGVKRMEWMMERLNHPERKIKTIHIGGTNGKGSTVCYLREILQESGYEVGAFISPYFEQFNERISVNSHPISDEELVLLVQTIQPLAQELEETELGSPTEFEIITAMALYYFAFIHQVDIVLFEVGLGGRHDSTNVIHPLLSIITNVGYDHTAILGDTIEKIAFEKAGIIKQGVPVITAAEKLEALAVITQKVTETNSKIYLLGKNFSTFHHTSLLNGESFSIETPFKTLQDVKITMKGAHQVKNASLAVMAVHYLNTYYSFLIEEKHIRLGLEKAMWIGRFEQISEDPKIIIDGAHNPEGVQSLLSTIETHLHDKKIEIIFCAMHDKNLHEMIDKLANIAQHITFTSFDFPRAASAKELYEICQKAEKSYDENWMKAIDEKIASLSHDSVLIITGSLYFLANIRPYVLQKLAK